MTVAPNVVARTIGRQETESPGKGSPLEGPSGRSPRKIPGNGSLRNRSPRNESVGNRSLRERSSGDGPPGDGGSPDPTSPGGER